MSDAELRVEYMPLADVASAKRNPRKHAIASLGASIDRFGFVALPVLDERTGCLVAGHGRIAALRAAQSAGAEAPLGVRVGPGGAWLVPVQRGHSFASDREAEAYLVADNRVSELATWDDAGLAELLAEHAGALEGLGYSEADVDAITRAGAPVPNEDIDAEPQIDRADELRKDWGVEAGQLWALGDHLLLCGDSTKREDVARAMGGENAAVCLTDPPYGLGANKASGKNAYAGYDDTRANLEDLARKWLPIARDVAPVVCFSPGVTNAWIYPEASWVMCWFYGGGQLRSSWGFNCWQPFLCYGKDPSLASGHGCRPDAVDMNTPANAGDIDHPCPKPTKLWLWFIERLSFDRADTFYDPFSGSGTTIIACEQLGRKCRAIEISPGYVAVALQRFKDATGKTPSLAALR